MTTATFPSFSLLSQVKSFVEALQQSVAPLFVGKAPKAAHALTVSEEAEELRAMANTYVNSEPGFAQDLYAAADRHEFEHGAI